VAKENESHVTDFFLKLIKERENLPEPLQPIVQNAVVWVTDSQKDVTFFFLLVFFLSLFVVFFPFNRRGKRQK
jgi:hypothetical protein